MIYELSYIIKGDLEEANAKEATQGLVGFISEIGGESKIIKEVKTQPLAYPIKKQTQGFWGVVEFNLEAEKLLELEKKLKENKEIIRFMITKKPSLSVSVLPKVTSVPSVDARKVFKKNKKPATTETEKEKEEKVEIKDLDKKLEEILKEV